MMRLLTPKGRGFLTAACGAAGLVACATRAWPDLALVNESASLPRGLYLRQFGAMAEPGAIAAVAQPVSARDYLEILGAPPDMLLIKRVAAQGGDLVCRVGDKVLLPAGAFAVSRKDRLGTPLPTWSECRRLSHDEIFLLGDTGASFDSRYFGPVRNADLRGVYRGVITW